MLNAAANGWLPGKYRKSPKILSRVVALIRITFPYIPFFNRCAATSRAPERSRAVSEDGMYPPFTMITSRFKKDPKPIGAKEST